MTYYHNLWSRQKIEAVTQTLFHPFKTGYFKLFFFSFPFLCIFFCSFVTIVHVIDSFIRALPIICQRPQPGRLTAYCFKISNQRSFLVLRCCCDYCHFDFLNWGALCFFFKLWTTRSCVSWFQSRCFLTSATRKPACLISQTVHLRSTFVTRASAPHNSSKAFKMTPKETVGRYVWFNTS